MGRPDLVAWRPSGKFFWISERNRLCVPWKDRVRTPAFTLGDLLTDDWRSGERDKMLAELQHDATSRAV